MLPARPDSLVDCLTDLSACGIAVGGRAVVPGTLDSWERYARGEWGGGRITNRYADYYHGDYGIPEVRNEHAQTGESLPIVGDSYTNCPERFLAANYAHVYKIDVRHAGLRADTLLAAHPEVGQVLVVGQVGPILAGGLTPE